MARYHKPTLVNEFAWATECNLATLDELVSIKSVSTARIDRQQSICEQMLETCRRHEAEIEWVTGIRSNFGRVEELLKAIQADGAEKAFAAYIGRLCSIFDRKLPTSNRPNAKKRG